MALFEQHKAKVLLPVDVSFDEQLLKFATMNATGTS